MASSTSSVIPTPCTPYAEAVTTFINTFSLWDIPKLLSYISDDAERIALPASLGRPTAKGKEELRKAVKSVQEIWFDFIKFEVLEYIEATGRAVLHARTIDTVSKTNAPYQNEYIFIFHFNTENKITIIKEFGDSAFVSKFFGEEIERQKKRDAE